jgi:anti-sigma-K factor RskA
VSGVPEQDLQDLAAAYALGALEPAEARAFEALLATSADARRELAAYQEVGALLAAGTPAVAPSPDLKARTMARATEDKVVALPARRTGAGWAPWAAVAASLVAVVGLALSRQGLQRRLAEQDTRLAELQDTLTVREAKLATREAELNAILDPHVTLTRMGAPGSPQPVVQLFWNRRNNQMLVHAFQLPPAASKRAYQLWFLPKNGKPIPSVTFNSEPSGHALVQAVPVPGDLDLTAAALTDEPEGGSPQPTTTPFLVASFGRRSRAE